MLSHWAKVCLSARKDDTLESIFTYIGYRVITALSNILPRNWQYAIAHRVADAHYLFDKRARDSVKANLRVILGPDTPEEKIRHDTRWVFRSFGMYLCEFLGYKQYGPEFIDAHVAVKGREHLEAAFARGKGIIFCSAHYSNWELGATTIAHMGYPVVAITQMHTHSKVNEMFVRQRALRGLEVVHSDRGAKAALKALRQNRTVAVLGDRTTGGPVVNVRLFGRRTGLPQGPWRMAYVSGAALLPTFLYRGFNNSYTLEFCAPVDVPSGDRAASMSVSAQAWADQLEARVRVDPCQWATFTPFWDACGMAGHNDGHGEVEDISVKESVNR
jgi:lauroyl/myristoyl acyltransferase